MHRSFQSHNIEHHRQIAADLLHSNAAYEDQGALRIRTPTDGEVFFDDRVGGRLAVQNKELEDPVILRGDKTPTYVFASAVDDIKDRISDVIRGDDHVRNTHKTITYFMRRLNKNAAAVCTFADDIIGGRRTIVQTTCGG